MNRVVTSALRWSRYRDVNPVPTSPLIDDIATSRSGSVVSILSNTNNSTSQMCSCEGVGVKGIKWRCTYISIIVLVL